MKTTTGQIEHSLHIAAATLRKQFGVMVRYSARYGAFTGPRGEILGASYASASRALKAVV